MIPLSVPRLGGNEWQYIKECLDTNWVSSVGSYVDLFEQRTAEYVGARYAVACSNGTAALHISLQLAGIRPHDYVLVPDITFIAPVNTIRYCGANPIFIDIDPRTWQMDLDLLESFLKDRTEMINGELHFKGNFRRIRAVLPVHVLGNMTDMPRLVQLAKQYGLEVVEDATEALGSYYKGRHAGTFGKLGCFSYNGNKIITTGGGGTIVTDDEVLARRAKHLTTQAKSDSMEYIHDEVGYNYRLVNILAAMGVAQMEQLPEIRTRKHEIARFYYENLRGVGDVVFQEVAPDVNPNQWLFTIQTAHKDGLLAYLQAEGIQSRPLWLPMHRLAMYKDELFETFSNESDRAYDTCLSIPCSGGITNAELGKVAQAIRRFFAHL